MNYKVLLAEDERALRTIVNAYLSSNGFDIDTVSNGEEAIDAVNRKVYDIVVLDIMMPKRNGIEVCQEIRKKEMNKKIILKKAVLNSKFIFR